MPFKGNLRPLWSSLVLLIRLLLLDSIPRGGSWSHLEPIAMSFRPFQGHLRPLWSSHAAHLVPHMRPRNHPVGAESSLTSHKNCFDNKRDVEYLLKHLEAHGRWKCRFLVDVAQKRLQVERKVPRAKQFVLNMFRKTWTGVKKLGGYFSFFLLRLCFSIPV